ncbi:protocadherin-like wing polarity protein stan isoform X1 [Anopheles albimanus]|uniref:protocadherin-like wing polarity protein stan isoform X1 n=1 Tax=Anopheles albimanus TaxID=7167 RepID=UPI00163EF328|nr:protocadherin-like wing polarity protein stan isoform X1 [Anopheles albimanus]
MMREMFNRKVQRQATAWPSSSSRLPAIGLLILVLLQLHLRACSGYMIIASEDDQPGKVLFNSSVYKLGSERHYKINAHKSAHYVHHLLRVDPQNGQVSLKRQLKCDGIYYPTLFTFYVDSTSNRLRSIDYYSLPIRIFIVGRNCSDEDEAVAASFRKLFEEDDTGYHHSRFRRGAVYRLATTEDRSLDHDGADGDDADEELQQRMYGEYRGDRFHYYRSEYPWLAATSRTNYSTFREGDILFDSVLENEYRHDMISRKRREIHDLPADKIHRKIADAKQWISETYASYAIHTTDKWKHICLKKSQYINSINAFLPKTVLHHCTVRYLDVNDERFEIETRSGDLIATGDLCIPETLWKVIITYNVRCDRRDIIDADHRLKIVYHHQELNDTDIAKRVRRELRNQSPFFEQALYVASVLEEQPAGATVITVRARDPEDSPVVYSLVSLLDSRSQSMFKVDSRTGLVLTSATLDRELMDVHYFRVIATDDSFPPRSGTTTLQVNVLDCNDHTPTFEAEQFHATVREGVSVGSTVITIRATDQDIGKNAEIEYSITSITGERESPAVGRNDEATGVAGTSEMEQEDSQKFRIDARSGTISTRSALDREVSGMYTIAVTASDMATPQTERKSATTTVLVKILDDNDNYPQFSERTYTVQVREDQWTNENNVIAHIQASDADQGNNAAIRFAIIGGNTQSQFSIDSMSGDVSLVKPLDYESVRSYRLVIRAQDGGSPSRSNTTQLLVNVLDANDNAPRFYTSQFQEAVLESVPVGYNIVRVQAYDADEGANSEITYSILNRDDSMPLTVDPRTGWIHTTKGLDREEQSRYSFQVVAVDGGIPPKSASTSVIVTIQDVNDNDPTFSPKYYEAMLAEDQPPGTPVTTVTATDPDEDARLHYEITAGNTRGRFAITSQNGRGLITIAQPLDYKQERRFALTITATDSGQRTDTAIVNINITDANNFAPVFENAPYSASVFEDAPIGTTVLVVSATDSDVGINAQITYLLNDESVNGLGANEPFTINAQTGAVVTNAKLDRETTAGYLLTVTAKDGGNPSLSDTTDVEIAVTDVNDNAPVFKVPLYQATIPEDALIGTSVVQIGATDLDMGLNGRVKYALSQKDMDEGSFVVDPISGVIRTNKGLDRESIPVYHLSAIASDKGTPTMSSTVEVQIRLDDVNDSPPTFASDKLTLYVPENSPVGSVVGEIYAHDPDEGVNAIVHYSIIGGDDSNSFSLVTRPGSDRAQLLTMTELDYESSRKRFELIIRAASPPLRNDVSVDILVTDVNDNAPVLRDFQVIFNNFRDCFPSGVIGRIPAFDADVTDKLTYRILSGNNANLLRLNTSTGGLTLSPQLNTNVPKFATMEVSVTDGINEAKAIMQLIVRLITEDMLFNSVTVRLDEMTEEAFLSPLLSFFLDGLAAIIPCPRENIFLFSLQDDTDVSSKILNVSFSARRPDVAFEEYYTSQYLQERIYLNRAILARLATVNVLPFDDNLCVREPCLNYEQCLSVLKFGNASGFIHSDTVLFRPIHPVNTFACKCPEGFTGSKEHYLCDTEVDLCYSDPCQNGGSCVRREGGYTCVCSEQYTGVNCETAITSLKPCISEVCGDGYSCLTSGHGGHWPPYTKTCELMSRSFSPNSFLTFPGMRQRHRFNIRLKFATVRDSGLLLYNGRYNEQHDFIALEIIDGRVVFSFSLGDHPQSVSVHQQQHRRVSDGNWHTVEVKYFNRTVLLSLDGCDTATALAGLGERWNCANQTTLVLDRRCASLVEPCHRFFDLTGPLQIGGLPKISADFQIPSHSFVGCISDLYIDHRYVDLGAYTADNGTIAGCPQKAASCASEPCFNGGTCREGWGEGWECDCPDGFTGNACQESVALPWRFQGDGILSFNPLLRPIQLPWLTAFSIRTRKRDSFVMEIQVGQNSSAIVSLRSGTLQYAYNGEVLQLAGAELADGRWHRVEIKWMGAEVALTVDYGQRMTVLPVSQKIQGLYVGRIVIGGSIAGGGMAGESNFEGCIQDVRVGGVQSVLKRPTVRENVIDGCASNAKCPEDGCPQESVCVTNWDEAYCECLHGYVGEECKPVCTVKPCSDDGICRADTFNARGYRCECNSSLSSGEYCENRIQQPCPAGWWGERSCGPCKCNVKQGYHPNCDKTTGQCYCRENHYQPTNDRSACLPCECYAIGSYGKSCNSSGQCECREGVIGRRCDSCSNPYAEVTLNGCEVVYDGCPKSHSAGLWWPRTAFGELAVENCPAPARGKGTRRCDQVQSGWGAPDMFNCTSEAFLELRKQLAQIEVDGFELNTFVSVKVASSLRQACGTVGGRQSPETGTGQRGLERNPDDSRVRDFYTVESGKSSLWREEEFELDYLADIGDQEAFRERKLYGADLLITDRLLHELMRYESYQAGLNLSHSQDKHFVRNLVESAGEVLDRRYAAEWKRVQALTQHGPDDLVEAFNRYMIVLSRSQHDTYTNPFEIVHSNMVLGMDIVTAESLFGYETQMVKQQTKTQHQQQHYVHSHPAETVILPDTSTFLQTAPKQKAPFVAFPKYNNYIQDRSKFDRHTRVLVPLDMLGIAVPDRNEVLNQLAEHRAIVSYAQYKDAGALFPANFDETVTRRWGVEMQIASSVVSIAIVTPESAERESLVAANGERNGERSSSAVETIAPPTKHGERQSEKLSMNNEIKISIHDMSDREDSLDSLDQHAPELPVVEDGGQEFFHEGNAPETVILSPRGGEMLDADGSSSPQATSIRRKRRRSIVSAPEGGGGQGMVESDERDTEASRTNYVPLGHPHLPQALKLQMWLNIPRNRFASRSNPQCVRWNTHAKLWTRIGCQTEIPNYEAIGGYNDTIIVNCTCNQLATYAVLVDIIDPEDIPEPSLLVQITSYSAFLIALPVLFAVIISLALLRGLQTNSNSIHQNLLFCIFTAEVLFFVAIQARRELLDNEFPCKLVAIGLHYSWLAAFAWTTVDCVHLYRMLTEMRDINHGPMGFYHTMGYGAPALLVGLAVGVRVHEYGNSLFCWLSVYESVIWWMVGPIAIVSVFDLFILFLSVRAAFTIKDHVLGFGNLRTLLWLSVVSLPLLGIMWVLAVLAASDNSQLLNMLLSAVVILHALFSLVGYCIINKRVRENLHNACLRCLGRKVPLLDSSIAISNSSQNVGSPKTPGFAGGAGQYETARRNIGISTSSTTSRSTAKTSSSPYRSDGQFRHTSTSTSNYNSDGVASYMRGHYDDSGMKKSKNGGGHGRSGDGERRSHRRQRRDSDSGSETDGRSLELASSHSSDDEESRVGRNSSTHRSTGVCSTSYLPNITEHVATTPPELHVVQSPQLFPNVTPTRWPNQNAGNYLPPGNGRWSQETGSDNEAHPHKSPTNGGSLPNPDITETSYLHQNRMNMPPSILENIQESYNIGYSTTDLHSDRYSNYGPTENYVPPAADYGKRYESPTVAQNPHASSSTLPHHYASSVGANVPLADSRHTGSMQIINHMRAYPTENPYALKESLYDRSRTLGYGAESPYHGHPMAPPGGDLYSPPGSHVMSFKSSVQSLLKNDYQQHQQQQQQQQQQRQHKHHPASGADSDRMSEGSDKNPYNFPYTAEEDHLVHSHSTNGGRMHHGLGEGLNGLDNGGTPPPPQRVMRATDGLSPAPLQSMGSHLTNGASLASGNDWCWDRLKMLE